MKRKKIIRYSLLLLLLVVSAAAFYIYREYNRTHTDTAKLRPDFSVSATSLISEFESNETGSNKKYWDKVLRVEGVVKEIARDEKGFYSVVLGDTAAMSAVRCSVDSQHHKEAAALQKGMTVAVKGICSGFNADELLGSDVILVRSVIDSKQN
ncbi:MAG: OB-fold protein [Chitinophagaceae bacterium]